MRIIQVDALRGCDVLHLLTFTPTDHSLTTQEGADAVRRFFKCLYAHTPFAVVPRLRTTLVENMPTHWFPVLPAATLPGVRVSVCGGDSQWFWEPRNEVYPFLLNTHTVKIDMRERGVGSLADEMLFRAWHGHTVTTGDIYPVLADGRLVGVECDEARRLGLERARRQANELRAKFDL